VSSFFSVPLTTPLVVQQKNGVIMTDFGIVDAPTHREIGEHWVIRYFLIGPGCTADCNELHGVTEHSLKMLDKEISYEQRSTRRYD
jgi:hypothetical protein